MCFKTGILVLSILVFTSPTAVLADGDINLPVTIGGSIDFNIGPVASVEVAEVVFTGDASMSVFDCSGEPYETAPGIYVHFDDEGLPSMPPMIQYAVFPGDLDLSLTLQTSENSWNVLLDGVARIYAETWAHTEAQGCTLVTPGHITIDGNSVDVHLVYTSVVGDEKHVWSKIKVMYR